MVLLARERRHRATDINPAQRPSRCSAHPRCVGSQPISSQALHKPWEEETRVNWIGLKELKKRGGKPKWMKWAKVNTASSPFSGYLKTHIPHPRLTELNNSILKVLFLTHIFPPKKGKLWIGIWKSVHKFINLANNDVLVKTIPYGENAGNGQHPRRAISWVHAE